MIKNKYFLLLATTFVCAIVLCSCRSADSGYSRQDHKHTDNGMVGTSDGYGYNTTDKRGREYNAGITGGAVTGGDTVGNSVKSIMGHNAVGEKDGMTGTANGALGKGIKNTAKATRDVADGIGEGAKDVGRGIMNGAGTVMNGIDSRNAGGSTTPNYTK